MSAAGLALERARRAARVQRNRHRVFIASEVLAAIVAKNPPVTMDALNAEECLELVRLRVRGAVIYADALLDELEGKS